MGMSAVLTPFAIRVKSHLWTFSEIARFLWSIVHAVSKPYMRTRSGLDGSSVQEKLYCLTVWLRLAGNFVPVSSEFNLKHVFETPRVR